MSNQEALDDKISYGVFWKRSDNEEGAGGVWMKISGQISILEYQQARDKPIKHCSQCVCRRCLYWWSGRCPYGGCWDNHRAEVDPYDKAHPDKLPRTVWIHWDKPGEQAQEKEKTYKTRKIN